jgi:hypothetical protein
MTALANTCRLELADDLTSTRVSRRQSDFDAITRNELHQAALAHRIDANANQPVLVQANSIHGARQDNFDDARLG